MSTSAFGQMGCWKELRSKEWWYYEVGNTHKLIAMFMAVHKYHTVMHMRGMMPENGNVSSLLFYSGDLSAGGRGEATLFYGVIGPCYIRTASSITFAK